MICECVIFSLHFNILDAEAFQPVVPYYGQVLLEQEAQQIKLRTSIERQLQSDFDARVSALCVRPCRYTEASLPVYQRRPHTGLPLALTTHLLVFLLKRRQNIGYFLLLISQSLSLTAVEEVHLCLSPLVFIQAQLKQLTAELWQLILICEDELKNSSCSFPLRFTSTFAHAAKDECKFLSI